MSKRLLLLIITLTVAVVVAIPFIAPKGVSKIEITKVDPAFSAYVSAYTSGIISNESYIRIRLAEDYQGAITFDKPVEEEFFSFDPDIEGQTFWIDSRTLEFRPAKRLPSAQEFIVEFYLSKLLPDVPKDLSTMRFSVHTMKQGVDVVLEGMKTTDRKTLRWQQLNGTLSTNDAADEKIAEQTLTVTQNGKKLPVRWTHEGNHVVHHFTVDSISRGDKAGEVLISWDGKPLGVEYKNSVKKEIPSLKDFKVMDVRVMQGEEQCVVVEFSDPVMEKQNLDGLILLKGHSGGVRTSVEDNTIRVYPDQHLAGNFALNITPGIKNILGFKLPHGFTQQVNFEDLKPQVRLTGKGVILPSSEQGMLFPFQAVSLNAVDIKIIRIYENNIPQFLQVNSLDGSNELYRVGKVVLKKKIDLNAKNKADYNKWTTYSLDLGELIKTEPGAIYRVTIGFKKDYSVYNCPKDSATTTEAPVITEEEPDDEELGYYGNDYYDDYYYWWYEGDRDNPCDPAYYYGRSVSRNILASDLGLIAKRGNDGSMIVAVNQLQSTMPVTGADIEIYDFQNQLLTRTKSDAEGLAKIDLPKKKTFLMIARFGNQKGYLKLDDGSSLSLSAFDVSGASVQKGLKGFIYGERGVWRPGDTLFLSFILEDKQKKLPATHPVAFELINPRGQTVSRITKAQSVNGFYNFTTVTEPDAPTGNWLAKVKVGGATFTKNIKVETIMPNRLKIELDFGSDKVLSSSSGGDIKLKSRWLHGAIARNLKAQVDVSLFKTKTTFKGYDNYSFDDPATNFYTENQTVFDGRLNENGESYFAPKIAASQSPGMLKASFTTRVFEEGGAFSSDYFSVNYSPYNSYVGVLTPKSSKWGGMLETDKDQTFLVASVDQNGKPVSRSKVSVKVYKVDWRWWWHSDEENLAHYINSAYYSPFFEKEISTVNGKGSFKFKVDGQSWGRYLVRVTDEESGHSTGSVIYFDWPYWDGSSVQSSEAASLLQFSANKTKYTVGENILLTIPSPGQGRALISIENGSKIVNAYWAETASKGNIIYTIPVTADMAPNVYVSVTLIQPHGQVKNDAPIRLYGVIPVEVDNPESHITPVIATAPVWKPEEQAAVTVSEQHGKEMTYTLAIVDEGLLDLTRFKTPDPWNNFYAREALGVKTWDMYDLVMGAYGAELGKVLGIGGDGEEGGKTDKKPTASNLW
ncbi:MAG: hypothetical protein Fur0041_10040 [Bacteroidia bacterium]